MKVKSLWRELAGVEAGIIAGGVLLLYLMLDAAVRGLGVWGAVNLFASNLYGITALGGGFRKTTISGLAWLAATSGALGWGISVGVRPFLNRPWRCVAAAVVFALGWYYAVVRSLWPMWNPLARRQPFPALLFGYVLFGIAMGGYPKFAALAEKAHSGGAGATPESAAASMALEPLGVGEPEAGSLFAPPVAAPLVSQAPPASGPENSSWRSG